MKTKTLYINSGGGSSEAGLKAGKYISDNNIQVVASLRCFSSCANYFFLPSKTRAVLQDTEIGMHGGYQSYWKTFLALKNKVAPKHQDHLDATLVDQKIKIKQEIELLKNAQINPAIITYSADKTLYGSNTWYIEIDGEATKYGIPQERNSVFELWFPATIHYDRWGIIISKHTIQQIPRPFISHLERAKNLAPKHPEIYLTREE